MGGGFWGDCERILESRSLDGWMNECCAFCIVNSDAIVIVPSWYMLRGRCDLLHVYKNYIFPELAIMK